MSQLTGPGKAASAPYASEDQEQSGGIHFHSNYIARLKLLDPDELPKPAADVLETAQGALNQKAEKSREKDGREEWRRHVADIHSSLSALCTYMLSPGHLDEVRRFLVELQLRAGTDPVDPVSSSATHHEPSIEARLMSFCEQVARLPEKEREQLHATAKEGATRLVASWNTTAEAQFPLVRDVDVLSISGTIGTIEASNLAVAPRGTVTLQRGTQVASQGDKLSLLEQTDILVESGEIRFGREVRPNSPTGFSGVPFRCAFPAGSSFNLAA